MRGFVRQRFWIVLFLALLLGFSDRSFAQVGGSVSGTIKDPTGGVVPGATVVLMNTTLGTQFNVVTDGQGLYSFPNVPVGSYDLTVTLEGFKPYKRTGLAINADSRLKVDATLEIGEQTRDGDGRRKRRPRRNGVHAARRGGDVHQHDHALAQRTKLHGPAAHSAGRRADDDDHAEFGDHGRRHRDHQPVG